MIALSLMKGLGMKENLYTFTLMEYWSSIYVAIVGGKNRKEAREKLDAYLEGKDDNYIIYNSQTIGKDGGMVKFDNGICLVCSVV